MHAPALSLARDHPPRLGLALAVVAVFFGACTEALIKSSSASLGLWQLLVLRSALVAAVLLAILRWRGSALDGLFDRWVLLRGALLAAMYVTMYVALPAMPLAAFAAAIYTMPLFMTALSALQPGGRVTAAQWAAVALGFGAVLLVLRPDAGLFSAVALLPLLAALMYALAGIVTNRRCAMRDALVTTLSMNLMVLAVGVAGTGVVRLLAPPAPWVEKAPFVLSAWTAMGVREWLVVAALAAFQLITSLCVVRAYQIGPPPLVAVFEYSYLAFAAAWGFVLFGERPDAIALLGLALLAVAGAVALMATGRRARR